MFFSNFKKISVFSGGQYSEQKKPTGQTCAAWFLRMVNFFSSMWANLQETSRITDSFPLRLSFACRSWKLSLTLKYWYAEAQIFRRRKIRIFHSDHFQSLWNTIADVINRLSSDEKTSLYFQVNPVLHLTPSFLGLMWTFRYALKPEE